MRCGGARISVNLRAGQGHPVAVGRRSSPLSCPCYVRSDDRDPPFDRALPCADPSPRDRVPPRDFGPGPADCDPLRLLDSVLTM